MTYEEMASSYAKWEENFDVDAVMSEAEFDSLSMEERLKLITDAFGPDMRELDQIRVAFDNAGGVVIAGPTYAHDYPDGEQPANDLKDLLAGGDINQWDGNNEELLATLTPDELDRYEKVYTVAEIADLLKDGKVVIEDDDVEIHDGRRNVVLSGYSESQFFRILAN